MVSPTGVLDRAHRDILLIGFDADEAARLVSTLEHVGYRTHSARDAREAARALDAHPVGLALANLEGAFHDVLGAIEAVHPREGARCRLLGLGSVTAGAAMTDALRVLGLEGLIPGDVTPQELVFRVNAALFPDCRSPRPGSRRVPVDLPATFDGPSGPLPGVVLNLSETGLFLAAERLLPTNRTVNVRFAVRPGGEPITVTGRVVWSSAGGDGRRYFQGMGLQFLQMRPAAGQALKAFLADAYVEFDGRGEGSARGMPPP